MGGYQRTPKVYKLRFEDDEYDGLVVRARSIRLGAFLELSTLVGVDPTSMRPEDTAKIEQLFQAFAGALVDWNLEDEDGTPVPATFEGLASQEADFVLPIVKAWFAAVASVPRPLPAGSSNGQQSLEASIPMETR
jgi:hypothetical protein